MSNSLYRRVRNSSLLYLFLRSASRFLSSGFAFFLQFYRASGFSVVALLHISASGIRIGLSIQSRSLLGLISFILSRRAIVSRCTDGLFSSYAKGGSYYGEEVRASKWYGRGLSVASFFASLFSYVLRREVRTPNTNASASVSCGIIGRPTSLCNVRCFQVRLSYVGFFLQIFVYHCQAIDDVYCRLGSQYQLKGVVGVARPTSNESFYQVHYRSLGGQEELIRRRFHFSMLACQYLFCFSARSVVRRLHAVTRARGQSTGFGWFFHMYQKVYLVTTIQTTNRSGSL